MLFLERGLRRQRYFYLEGRAGTPKQARWSLALHPPWSNPLPKRRPLARDPSPPRLPVVDDHGKLIGIISRGDVIRAALEARKQR